MSQETSQWVDAVQIDGVLNEWGDSLTYYFEDQDLYYSVANNEDFLFVTIRVKDRQKQIQACLNGFDIMVNKTGKRKEGPALTFPLPNRAALRSIDNRYEEVKDIRIKTLNAVRAFHVKGFPAILDGPISLENNYGIQAAAKIDSSDNLCFEGALRLDQLGLTNGKPFALNIKINGIVKLNYTSAGSMNQRRRYPYGYSDYPRTRVVSREEPGAWHLFSLASKP